ncbi:aBC-type antimicrobial peptide transport system permease component [Mycoplasma sp. CAG:776]|nr:aBC-type antimicrobial peptide transport system permease component [Mycoplasma sp. CAG:776]
MRLLYKLSFVKMRKNIGRFLSLLFIVALGVGFFAGLRETTPDIEATLDNYYDEHNLMDFKIVSTMGLTEDDIASLEELKNIEKVVASYSVDTLIDGEAVRIHAIEEDINNVDLVEGNMPENNNECIADATKYKIGDTLTISKLSQEGILQNTTYKVVGLANSPMYLSRQMGIASIGTGELASFIYIPKENFNSEYYTEVYLTAKGSLKETAYEKGYEETTNLLLEELEELKPIRETKRYEEILEEATIEIRKIEDEANEKISIAEEELQEALEEINNGRTEIYNAKNEIITNENKLKEEEQNGLTKINNARLTWEESNKELKNTLASLGLTEETLETALNTVKSNITSIKEILNTLPTDDPKYAEYQKTLEELNNKKDNLQTLVTTSETLKNSKIEIDNSEKELEEQIKASQDKLNKAKEKLETQEQKIESAYEEYVAGENTLEEQKKELEAKINEAKSSLAKIEKPVWYLLDRTDNNGYSSIWDDAAKVDAIAGIFPIFFIIVVALMCFNTMNRMIEEERGEIGVLSSLGYGSFNIINGYLFYVFFATVIGVTIGLLIGYTLIPNIIYSIYNANYILPSLNINMKLLPFFIIILITLGLMSLIAIISCLKELKNVPATILRPATPKSGKKVLLEHIKFIWKRLSFTGKVTARNMFRYKKRIVMTVLGVVGSTALLLTGFGLRDSISGLADLQYGKINHYDALLVFQNSFKTIEEEWKSKLKEDNITEYLPIYQASFTFEAKDLTHDVYLIALENNTELNNFITLNSKVNENFTFPEDGVIISEKMADLLNVKIGDFIKLRNSNNELVVLPVSEIVENYTLHYVYMNKETYEKYFEKELEYNMIMTNLNEETSHEDFAEKWIDSGLVSTINFTEDNILVFDNMVKGLNLIIVLIIGASCMLAFIVLYNLTTINIAERIREISTLKVLGFYDKEVSSYVYRETLFLTIIGILIGLGAGIFLHMYVINVAETDNILFLHSIKWYSYIFSFLIIIFFTILVQIITNQKLKKINMVESLKSVE